MGVASLRMWCYLHSTMKPQNGATSSTSANRDAAIQKALQNIVKTLVIVCICFLICWSPSVFIYFLFRMGVAGINLHSWYKQLSTGLYLLNSSINPIIYVLQYQEFQQALVSLIKKKRHGASAKSTARAWVRLLLNSMGLTTNIFKNCQPVTNIIYIAITCWCLAFV